MKLAVEHKMPSKENEKMRKTKKILALALAGAMLFGQTVYAENVVTAAQPGEENAQANGPTGEKKLNEKGYLVLGGIEDNNADYVNAGPGAAGGQVDGAAQQTGTAQNPTQVGGDSAAGSSAGQIKIDESIAKPEVASETAALYDAATGQFLYAKDMDKAMYPASMTKLMTALLAAERLKLDDKITISAAAVTNLEAGAATAGMAAGDTMTVKDALYALLLKSACEVANALGEAVSGSTAEFAALMNQKAQELGCTNTHFENASGLNAASHYTTAHDMALITKAALDNQTLLPILQTVNYTLPAAKNRGELKILNGNKMINPANAQYYAGIIGGKTGYTSKAGNTLAVGVKKDGHELISVVMKSTQKQYDDTKALLDYGFKLIAASGTAGQSSTANTQTNAGNTANTENANSANTANNNQNSAAAQGGQWVQTGSQKQYKKADGSFYRNEWLDLDGKTYFFGSDTNMCTGWKQFTNGAWYYFNPQDGAMVTNKWVTQDGKSYYLQSDGTMAKNTVINDTYRVDENGVYVEKLK